MHSFVFVPVPEWPAHDRIDYRLTTEVTNHTGIRYAVQRYDSYAWTHLVFIYWAFDLPRSQSLKDVPPRFQLNDISHVAPGLKTVYNQRFNVNEGMKRALRLYPVDPAAGSPLDIEKVTDPLYKEIGCLKMDVK